VQALSGRFLKVALREGMSETKPNGTRTAKTRDAARAERLKAALKANIAKRKAQSRARTDVSDSAPSDKK
jgi:hypothetical protein